MTQARPTAERNFGGYAKVAAGKLTNFTGFDSPYEPPLHPEIVLDTAGRTPEEVTRELIEKLLVRFDIS